MEFLKFRGVLQEYFKAIIDRKQEEILGSKSIDELQAEVNALEAGLLS